MLSSTVILRRRLIGGLRALPDHQSVQLGSAWSLDGPQDPFAVESRGNAAAPDVPLTVPAGMRPDVRDRLQGGFTFVWALFITLAIVGVMVLTIAAPPSVGGMLPAEVEAPPTHGPTRGNVLARSLVPAALSRRWRRGSHQIDQPVAHIWVSEDTRSALLLAGAGLG